MKKGTSVFSQKVGPYRAGNSSVLPAGFEPDRILVRTVNWLGDAVMTTPALVRLRERFPEAWITLLSPAKLSGLWEDYLMVNEVLVIGKEESIWSLARRIRMGKYDMGLILPNSPRSAFEMFLGRIPVRVGYATQHRRWLLTHPVPLTGDQVPMIKRSKSEILQLIQEKPLRDRGTYPASSHHLFHYLNLIEGLGGIGDPLAPRLDVAEEVLEGVRNQWLVQGNLTSPAPTHWVGINAGAEYGPAKRWPEEKFIQLILGVRKVVSCGFVLFGGQADVESVDRIEQSIRKASPAVNLVSTAGKTTLKELKALLKLCDVVVTNDTGPMHVAAAVGTKVVVPFGSTSKELTGPGLPWKEGHFLIDAQVPCAPCFLRNCPIDFRCMTSAMPVEPLILAVLSSLGLDGRGITG